MQRPDFIITDSLGARKGPIEWDTASWPDSTTIALESLGKFNDGRITFLRPFCQGTQHHLVESGRNGRVEDRGGLGLHIRVHPLHDLLGIALKWGAFCE